MYQNTKHGSSPKRGKEWVDSKKIGSYVLESASRWEETVLREADKYFNHISCHISNHMVSRVKALLPCKMQKVIAL